MITYAFEIRKWEKVHEYCVENCDELHISKAREFLPPYYKRNFLVWQHPQYSWLKLVPKRNGCCIRWWLSCPTCNKCRESLYLTPEAGYQAQRHSRRHPVSQVLTVRKRIALERKAIRQKRILERQRKKQAKLYREPTLTKENPEARRDLEKILAAMGTFTVRVCLYKNRKRKSLLT